tara:strand:- start:61 stop:531 length:471 start_codon:yes stop_codon:yes gene_type:complete
VSTVSLFTDGSVNVQSKIGYGAYLMLSDLSGAEPSQEDVRVKRFVETSSTKLELQTLLWALAETSHPGDTVRIYTDSQNIIGLPRRRERFETNNYFSKKGRKLNNYELYQAFYRVTDELNFELIKVQGHLPSDEMNAIDRIFTLVDNGSRDAQRAD